VHHKKRMKPGQHARVCASAVAEIDFYYAADFTPSWRHVSELLSAQGTRSAVASIGFRLWHAFCFLGLSEAVLPAIKIVLLF
jgi:hypothetical protein